MWEAIRHCDGNKAPGPDGFNLYFFKSQWSVVKDNVMMVLDEFFSLGSFDSKLNKSFITLIPKCAMPTCLNDYRPISLVGSMYKILAKVLANRLRSVINEVIGPNQFSFVKGKQILDCSLVANEVIDDIKRKCEGGLLFKVDFEKAYDSIDWSFLDLVMAKMRFGMKWRKWISTCVSTVPLSVLVNDSPFRQLKISRGLRQGCPLSLFLFNMAAEALSALIHKVVSRSLFNGIKVGYDELPVSHLQYADDTIIFYEPVLDQLVNIKKVLKCF